MDKLEILSRLDFGQRIAEDESDQLQRYFMMTDPWKRVSSGEIDVIYGPKGSGKSAIYSVLESETDELFDRGILMISAENPRGNTVFAGLTTDPPTSELEFINLWKLYFIVITHSVLNDWGIADENTREITKALEECNLVAVKGTHLRTILTSCFNYIRQLSRIESIQPGVDLNELTGVPHGLNFKVSFREPTYNEHRAGITSAERLIELLDQALKRSFRSLWILIDRLDVAFSENIELETNALRALFKVYNDIKPCSSIELKVFLRNDIWKRITRDGFREASHITKTITIDWNKESILNLIILRVLNNDILLEYLNVDKESILKDIHAQELVFYRIFPDQVDQGAKKPKTLDWMMSRVKDGQGVTAPREIIHLINEAKTDQIKLLQLGENDLTDEFLIGRSAIKTALEKVSKVRLEQTIYAEFPSLTGYIQQLENEKAEQTIETLSTIWGLSFEETQPIAKELHFIGFFEERGTKQEPRYWIPFIYRSELNIIQGAADQNSDTF
jgi:hypothetical protein